MNQPSRPVPYKELNEIFSVPSFSVDKVYLAQKGTTYRLTFCEDVNDLQDCRARCAVSLDFAAFKALAQMLYVKAMELDAPPADTNVVPIDDIVKKKETLQ